MSEQEKQAIAALREACKRCGFHPRACGDCANYRTRRALEKQDKEAHSQPARPLFVVDPSKTEAFFERAEKHTAQMALDRAAEHRAAAPGRESTPMSRTCAHCPRLTAKTGWCAKYRQTLVKEEQTGRRLRCVECVMEEESQCMKN